MIKCEQCGAVIDPSALECAYCKAPTRRAIEHQHRLEQEAQARAQWETQRSWQQEQVLGRQLASTAKQSLIFSILGLVTCFTPLGIIAIVQGFRARGMAQRLRASVPGTSTAGLVLGMLGCVTSVAIVAFGVTQTQHDEQAASERIAELSKQLGDKPAAAELAHDTACALAEIHARETGFDGHPGSSFEKFQCDGRLRAGSDAAELEAFRFAWTASTRYEVHACFKKGQKWYVSGLQTDACPDVAR